MPYPCETADEAAAQACDAFEIAQRTLPEAIDDANTACLAGCASYAGEQCVTDISLQDCDASCDYATQLGDSYIFPDDDSAIVCVDAHADLNTCLEQASCDDVLTYLGSDFGESYPCDAADQAIANVCDAFSIEAPFAWTCDTDWWGDDGCDCGCGVVDADCRDENGFPDPSAAACGFCFADCAGGNCDLINPDDNALCLDGELNAVTVSDQPADPLNMVVVAEVVTELGGFVVIHEDDDGNIGGVIGASTFLTPGTHTDVTIMLDRDVVHEETLYAMLHNDDGDEVYEFPEEAADGPTLDSDGMAIAPAFVIMLPQNRRGTCDSPISASDGFTLSGDNILADFSDTFTYSDMSCSASGDSPSSVDIVFTVRVDRGKRLTVSEHGDLDAVIKIQASSCNPDGPCEEAQDLLFDESEGVSIAPRSNTVYTVIVGASSPNPNNTDYDVRFSVVDAPLTALGLYEQFDASFDLEGRTLVIEPTSSDVLQYTHRFEELGDTFPVTPGSGDVTATTLELFDENAIEVVAPEGGTFSIYSVPHTSMFVSANGFITGGESDVTYSSSVANFFGFPRISGLDMDLNPAAQGTVYVDIFAVPEQAVITFEDVPIFGSLEGNSFQIVLFPNNSVRIHYINIADDVDGLGAFVGIGDGDPNATEAYPDPVDFSEE